MSRAATKLLIVAFALSLHGAAFLQRADAYTLTDWIRGWQDYRPAAFAAPLPAAPVAPAAPTTPPVITTPPVVTTPPPASTTPAVPYTPPATTPPAATAPSISPPAAAPPAPSCAAPPPSYTAPPPSCGVPAAAPSCGVPAAAPSCESRAPYYHAAPAAAAPRGCFGCSSLFGMAFRPTVRYRTAWVRVPTTNYRPVTTYDPCSGAPMTQVQPCTTYTWRVQRIPYTTYRPTFLGLQPQATYGTTAPGTYTPAAPVYQAPQMPPPTPYTSPASPLGSSSPGLQGGAPPVTAPAPYTPNGQPSAPADQKPRLIPDSAPTELNREPLPQVPPDPDETPGANQRSGTSDPTPSAARPDVRVIPVPDPESVPYSETSPIVPSLFHSGDRTAQRGLHRVAWQVAPIQWEHKRTATVASEPLPAGQLPAAATPRVDVPGSEGWKAVRD